VQVQCDLWVCADGRISQFPGDFEGYREKVINDIEDRERLAAEVLRKAQEKKRTKLAQRLGKVTVV
jgi:hypothetical protein